jgi:hypothetical protein
MATGHSKGQIMFRQLGLVLASAVVLAGAIAAGGEPALAAQKSGGGAFAVEKPKKQKPAAKPAPKKKAAPKPAKAVNYDGSYIVNARRTAKKNKFACLKTYRMTLVVRNGRARHKLPFGLTLLARARGDQLYISSTKDKRGDGWVGALGLTGRSGGKTSGYLKWSGSNAVCSYTMTVRRQ